MEVIGLSETIRAIQEAADAIAQRGKAAVKLGAQAYANDVKDLAPYDTGTLRRSIHVEPEVLEEGGKFFAIIGTDLPYARRQEFGFYDMVDSLGRHYYQYPHPYFRPPLDMQIGKYIAIMKGELDQWMESAELAGRSGVIYAAESMASSVTSRSLKFQFAAIGGTMRGDFGGFE